MLKQSLRVHFGLGPDDALTVSEIACPGCGPDGVETVVLVMRQGERTVALKCPRTMSELAGDPSLLVELTSDPDSRHRPSDLRG